MHGDRQAEPPRGLDLLGVDLGRHRGLGLLPPWPRQAMPSEIRPSFDSVPSLVSSASRSARSMVWVSGCACIGAVGEARAQAGFAQGPQVRLGEFGAADVVAPVVDEGDAGIDRLGRGQPGALVHVVGLVKPAERCGGAEIAVLRLVAGHAAQQRVPHVPVGLDEARQHDHALALDHRAPGASSSRPTATITPSWTCTSPPARSPAPGSIVMT